MPFTTTYYGGPINWDINETVPMTREQFDRQANYYSNGNPAYTKTIDNKHHRVTDFNTLKPGDVIYWMPGAHETVYNVGGIRYGKFIEIKDGQVWANWGCDKYGNGGQSWKSHINPKNHPVFYGDYKEPNNLPEPEIKDYTNMAFGARKVDEPFEINGKKYKQTWFLCLRKGRIIEGTAYPTGDPKDWIDFKFKSQKEAKACADELNEKYWNAYKDNGEVMEGFAQAEEMVNTIKGYLK